MCASSSSVPVPADFDFTLPPALIAQTPAASRTASRLLHVPADNEAFSEREFARVGELLRDGDLLVVNDTRVIPARLFGRKASGGRVEMLLERIVEPRVALAQLRSSRSPAAGSQLEFAGSVAQVEGRRGNFFLLRFADDVLKVLNAHGHVPLPPYIERDDHADDVERYQTVYAAEPGAVAAPTAGLHFDQPLLDRIAEQGVQLARDTLHVGAGTFLPLRDEQLRSGRLHAERVVVDASVCATIAATRAAGGRVIAVGTTVTRALEAAAAGGRLEPFDGETDLFIRPGYDFRVVDALITNFHLPQSSLLMLVCALRGKAAVLNAYGYAVAREFRFFSYGDAMFVERPGTVGSVTT